MMRIKTRLPLTYFWCAKSVKWAQNWARLLQVMSCRQKYLITQWCSHNLAWQRLPRSMLKICRQAIGQSSKCASKGSQILTFVRPLTDTFANGQIRRLTRSQRGSTSQKVSACRPASRIGLKCFHLTQRQGTSVAKARRSSDITTLLWCFSWLRHRRWRGPHLSLPNQLSSLTDSAPLAAPIATLQTHKPLWLMRQTSKISQLRTTRLMTSGAHLKRLQPSRIELRITELFQWRLVRNQLRGHHRE